MGKEASREGGATPEDFARPRYLNWDNTEDREIIQRQGWSTATDLLVLDEIHNMPGWESHLKGLWDTRAPELSVLVTRSARLEIFCQSGDSLAGRYFHHRLFPITPAEAAFLGEKRSLTHHERRGGFPEPWLAESDDESGRWRRQYLDGLIREDILALENISQLRAMNLLVELLRQRVASPLSYQGLSEDLCIAPNTVKHYMGILEALYIIFRVYPHHRSIARALVQQPKVYFFDTGLVRTGTGKHQDRSLAPSLRYFHERYGFPGVQVRGEATETSDIDLAIYVREGTGEGKRDLACWEEGLFIEAGAGAPRLHGTTVAPRAPRLGAGFFPHEPGQASRRDRIR
jgi:hypothetical protein